MLNRTDAVPAMPPPSSGLMQSSLVMWTGTVLFMLVGWLFMRRMRKSQAGANSLGPIPASRLVTRESKQGRIRTLNPEYIPRNGRQLEPDSVVYPASVCDAILKNLQEHPDGECFGWHDRVQDPYQWITLKQFSVMFTEFGSGLKNKFNIEPGTQTMLGIYGINCIEWVTAHMGMLFYANVAVPLYSTLGEEAMIHIVKLTQMELCVCFNEERAASLLKVLLHAQAEGDKLALARLKRLVIMRTQSDSSMNQLRAAYPQFEFYTMEEVRAEGRKRPVPYHLPTADQIYVLNFTSGTTGVPKGVIINCIMFHHVIVSILSSKNVFNTQVRWMDHNDVYFSFLPLAHVFEQCMMAACLFVRARIGFFSGDLSKLMLDIPCLRPTMLAMVPRLLIRIYDAFLTKLQEKHMPRWILSWAVASKLRLLDQTGGPVRNCFWDRFLFRPLQQKLGGRLRIVISGSAACPSDVLNFCRAALGATVHVGYGASETAGPVSITYTDDVEPSHVGAPILGMEVRLTDVPDMGLYPSKNPSCNRGEICVRGVSCTPGYYKEPEKTAELIDKDGWLHTGDVGEWDAHGRLKIVDRCKNMFKLSQGEYVAPDRVENVYLLCPLVAQVFVDGRPDSSFAISIVHPALPRLAERLQVRLVDYVPNALTGGAAPPGSGTSVPENAPRKTPEQLCLMPEARDLLLKEMTAIGKTSGMASFELAKRLHLTPEPFSIEQGLLTATLKPVRVKIRSCYQAQIDQLYALQE